MIYQWGVEMRIGTIEVVDYDPKWKKIFDQEELLLCETLSRVEISCHHFGSTAIPGMSSKPVIDIILEIASIDLISAFIAALEELGYEGLGECGVLGRSFFRRREDSKGRFSVHLHFFAKGHFEIERNLVFRDYLRTHPEDAHAYEKVKIDLAKKYPQDHRAYRRGKEEIILEMDARAKAWVGE
ncbi:MAG: GrpB-like predicted nucleotidyltransferase (UPF0157 family) [Chlamydiales bacterium]